MTTVILQSYQRVHFNIGLKLTFLFSGPHGASTSTGTQERPGEVQKQRWGTQNGTGILENL